MTDPDHKRRFVNYPPNISLLESRARISDSLFAGMRSTCNTISEDMTK